MFHSWRFWISFKSARHLEIFKAQELRFFGGACRLLGWIGGLAGWLAGWLAGMWLTDWLPGWLTAWLLAD